MSPEQSPGSVQPKAAELLPPEPLEYASPELVRELGTGRPALEALDTFCLGILAGATVAVLVAGALGRGDVSGAVCGLAGLSVVATVGGAILFGWAVSIYEIWSGRALVRRSTSAVFATGATYLPGAVVAAAIELRRPFAGFPVVTLTAAILFPLLAPLWLTRRSGKPFD